MINKLLPVCLAFALFASCADSQHSETKASEDPKPVVNDLSENPDYKKGLALVSQSDCLTCHAINETITGPAYADIAAKYAGAADTTITRLAHTIIKGGSGHWGAVPMIAHPNLSEEDAIQMVKYVLLLKK